MKRYLNNYIYEKNLKDNNIIKTYIETSTTKYANDNIYTGTLLYESSDIVGIAQWLDEESAYKLFLVKEMLDMCVLPSCVPRIDSYK